MQQIACPGQPNPNNWPVSGWEPWNYSARMIKAEHNNQAGNVILGGWYQYDRILAGDSFWVKIVS
jgi:hypothetical protein